MQPDGAESATGPSGLICIESDTTWVEQYDHFAVHDFVVTARSSTNPFKHIPGSPFGKPHSILSGGKFPQFSPAGHWITEIPQLELLPAIITFSALFLRHALAMWCKLMDLFVSLQKILPPYFQTFHYLYLLLFIATIVPWNYPLFTRTIKLLNSRNGNLYPHKKILVWIMQQYSSL